MKLKTLAATLAVMFLAVGAFAQAPPPQPGPAHAILEKDAGVWDVTMEMTFPGMPPMTMTGVETSTLMGGRWLITKFESDMGGQPFEGHGITGWDPSRKAYVGVWADTMGTQITHSESTYDAETDTLKGWMEMPDPMGGMSKVKTEEAWPEEGTRIVKVYGPDGGPEPVMSFTYTRRK
jgi:hypothetical protein